MVLLVRGDDEVDRVRERRVRDVVQQPGDLLAAVRPSLRSRTKTPSECSNRVTSLNGNGRADGPA